MKVNEITVGDWVHYSINLGEDNVWDEKMQIVDIYGNLVNCNIEYDIVISGYLISNLTPIPLTEEMLEVNGFLDYREIKEYQFKENGEEFRFYLKKMYNKDNVQDAWGTNIGGVLPSVIMYVHELQHALRLCGLSELADKFKIK